MLGAWPSMGLLVQPGHRAATQGAYLGLPIRVSSFHHSSRESVGVVGRAREWERQELMPTPP